MRSTSPADRDFTDLRPLAAAIGDSRIVLLGEESHGDGAAFLLKSRLIEFLHEEMGFDVLAFESGMYDCAKAWELLRGGEEARTAVRRGVFPIWTKSEQVLLLLDYLGSEARTDHPLELAGFDSQFTGSASREFLVDDLRAFLQQLGSAAVDDPAWKGFWAIARDQAAAAYVKREAAKPSPEEREAYLAKLDSLRAEIAACAARQPVAEAPFWRQMLASLGSDARMQWTQMDDPDHPTAGVISLRDPQMARNLLWLAGERFHGRKIIVWAHLFHISRHLKAVDGGPEFHQWAEKISNMGQGVWDALGNQTYVVGFTAYEGSYGTVFEAPQKLEKPGRGSLEDLLVSAGFDLALVDLRHPAEGGAWLHDRLAMRALGYEEMNADWSQAMDAVAFTRRMSPSTKSAQ